MAAMIRAGRIPGILSKGVFQRPVLSPPLYEGKERITQFFKALHHPDAADLPKYTEVMWQRKV